MTDFEHDVFRFIADANLAVVKELLQSDPGLANRNFESGTALSYAAAEGDVQMVDLLLSHSANPNQRNFDGSTALTYAHSVPVLKCLLSNGADPTNENNERGHNSLHNLAQDGTSEELDFLLSSMSRETKLQLIQISDSDNTTPLMYAIQAKSLPSVLVLLKHGANPDFQSTNDTGPRPLIYALWTEDEAIIRALISHGAKPEISEFDFNYCKELHPESLKILTSLLGNNFVSQK